MIFSCRAPNEVAPGCSDVSRGLEAGLQMNLDPDRELQRIHSLFIAHMERLDRLRCNYIEVHIFETATAHMSAE